MIKKILDFVKSRQFLINFGIAIVLLPLLIWLIFVWLGSYTRHKEFVDVPDFKDLKISQLDNFVADKNISYEIIDSLWDPKKPKGLVIKQDPDPGSKVKEGRTIYLYVTAVQPPKINMPKLEDLSMRQAQSVCESYGLHCSFTMVPDPCNGCVVRQEFPRGKRIEPGTPIEKGNTIFLNVGKGEENSGEGFPIPNLIGMNFRAARGKMIDLGLEWMIIPDPGVKDTMNAIIYSQEPAPGRGRMIIEGASIDLRVSADKSKLQDSVR